MAGDSAITVKELTHNGFKEFDTDTKQLLSSTAAITVDLSTMSGDKVLILVDRPADVTNPTIVVEDGGAYAAGAVGNVTKLTTQGGEYIFGPFETSRFQDTAGKINITKSTTDTTVLYVRALLMPNED